MYEIIKYMLKSWGVCSVVYAMSFSFAVAVLCSYALHYTNPTSDGFIISLFITIILSYFILIGKYEGDRIYIATPTSDEKIYAAKVISVFTILFFLSMVTYFMLYIFSNSLLSLSFSRFVGILLLSAGMSSTSPIISFLKDESMMLIISIPLILFPIVLPAINIFTDGISLLPVSLIMLSSLIFLLVGTLVK